MMIFLSPQMSDKRISYNFEGEKITATFNGISEVFDFSNMPNGNASAITSIFDFIPIASAKRIDDILYIEMINFISDDASYEERYPEWVDSAEYVGAVEAPKTPSEGDATLDEEVSDKDDNVPQEPVSEPETPLTEEGAIL